MRFSHLYARVYWKETLDLARILGALYRPHLHYAPRTVTYQMLYAD